MLTKSLSPLMGGYPRPGGENRPYRARGGFVLFPEGADPVSAL